MNKKIKENKITNFKRAINYLYRLVPSPDKNIFLGEKWILRMKDLLNRVGNPQNKFISVHIAGTSGKGSTSYLISKILAQTGKKIGLHTSPHLQDIRERTQINNQIISKKEFVNLVEKIRPAVEKMAEEGKYGAPSYFETNLAITFIYFAKKKVAIGVIETGLGGKLDGTNVLNSLITVLTNIGLDHTQILGNTKELILKDKMEIVKKTNYCAITAIKQTNLLRILKKHCQKKKVPLFVYGKNFKIITKKNRQKMLNFEFFFGKKIIKNISLNLLGDYQLKNSALAIATCLKLKERIDIKLSNFMIKKALKNAFFPGRMEMIFKKPLFILDGAHNGDKMRAFVESIKRRYPHKKFVVVFGIKKGKDTKKMLQVLKPIVKILIITQFSMDINLHLNVETKDIFKIALKIFTKKQIISNNKLSLAIKTALNIAKKESSAILLTGSLYLVGEARTTLGLQPNKKGLAKLTF